RKRPAALRAGLILGGLIALLSAGGLLYWRSHAAPATPTLSAPVTRGDLTVNVESSGSVKATQSLDLPFQADGQVREVLVRPGDLVRAGQPLARLDDHDLRLQVQQAEADLKTAQAKLDAAQHGGTTPQDLAQAQASLNSSLAALEKTRTGNVTAADMREAEASLLAVKAQLDALKNPSVDKISAAQLTLTQAQTALQQTRDELSAAKTDAEIEQRKVVAALTQAQSSYSTAKQNWDYVQETGNDPVNPTNDGANGKKVPNKLSNAQRQEYYDAFVKVEAALRSAEEAVEQAQLHYDSARQKEPIGIREAEAKASDAQQQLEALQHPNANSIAQAQAAVTQAQAKLDNLRQGGTLADIAQAQAQVDEVRAGLEKLTAPAAKADLAAAEANLAQAQAKLDTAKLKLDRATLTAPFAGTVASTSITPGSVVGTETAAVSLVDTSALYIDVSLSETDVARVKPGQSVSITFDALPDLTLKGTVDSVVPTGSSDQGVVTYPVRVKFDPDQAQVKVGMSASVSVEVERHAQVIQVPSRAIKSSGPLKTVQVLYGASKTPVTVPIETGATNGSSTEIKSCVDTGKQCLREGDQLVINLPTDTSQDGSTGGDQGPQFSSSGPDGPGNHIFVGKP
ncbi:MAG: efflux RND transporter periplasmic adaptor subunit, partial [Roseiflexaceae bacterium]